MREFAIYRTPLQMANPTATVTSSIDWFLSGRTTFVALLLVILGGLAIYWVFAVRAVSEMPIPAVSVATFSLGGKKYSSADGAPHA